MLRSPLVTTTTRRATPSVCLRKGVEDRYVRQPMDLGQQLGSSVTGALSDRHSAPSCAREPARWKQDSVLADNASTDKALESAVALVERSCHAEAVLERCDSRLDAAAPSKQPPNPALLL